MTDIFIDTETAELDRLKALIEMEDQPYFPTREEELAHEAYMERLREKSE